MFIGGDARHADDPDAELLVWDACEFRKNRVGQMSEFAAGGNQRRRLFTNLVLLEQTETTGQNSRSFQRSTTRVRW